MKKIILLFVMISFSLLGFSQLHKGIPGYHSSKPKIEHKKVITLKSDLYFVNKGGNLSEKEYFPTNITLYNNQIKISALERVIPKIYPIRNLNMNVGDQCEIGKYVIYEAIINNCPNKPIRYIRCYYSFVENSYFLEIEHVKYSQILRII